MENKMTIGYQREDGDIDVVATINIENCNDCEKERMRAISQMIINVLNESELIIFYRDDVPDVISLEKD